MARPQIRYQRGYKYQLYDTYVHELLVAVPVPIVQSFFQIIGTELIADAGYAWDGASGPAWDTTNVKRASLVHDVLYQAMEMRLLDAAYQPAADAEYRRICDEDGVNIFRRWYHFKLLRRFGHHAIEHGARPVLVAP